MVVKGVNYSLRSDDEFSSSNRNLRFGRQPDHPALNERPRDEGRQNIVIIGCSGHAKVVIDIVKSVGLYSIAGLIDTYKDQGTRFSGYEILGTEHDLAKLMVKHSIEGGVVAIGDNWTRFLVTERVRALTPDLFFPVIVHPSAQVASTAHVGMGSVILAGGIVNSDAQVGEFCIVSSKASLDHDSSMGRFASLMPGATVGGGVTIGEFSSICLGANVIHSVAVGPHTIVGAGAAVVRDIPSYVVAYGMPARVARSRTADEPYLQRLRESDPSSVVADQVAQERGN